MLLAHGLDDDEGQRVARLEAVADRLDELVGHRGHLEVLAGLAGLVHEGEVVLVGDVEERVLRAEDVGHRRAVRRGHDVLELLAREDVGRDEIAPVRCTLGFRMQSG